MEFFILDRDINLVTLGHIENFVTSCLKANGAVYAIMPILLREQKIPSEKFISISGQLVMTKDVNPRAILNSLELNVMKLLPDYGFEGKLHGVLLFK